MIERDARAGSCCTAHPAPPRTTPDFAKDITITAEFLDLARYVINNGVDPASEEFPTGTAILGNVIVMNTLLHGNIEVPCHDETIAGAGVENTFGGRTADELGGSVECEGRDAKAVARFVFAWRMESRPGMLCRVGDHDGVDRALSIVAKRGQPQTGNEDCGGRKGNAVRNTTTGRQRRHECTRQRTNTLALSGPSVLLAAGCVAATDNGGDR
jgi:hypothetical protein